MNDKKNELKLNLFGIDLNVDIDEFAKNMNTIFNKKNKDDNNDETNKIKSNEVKLLATSIENNIDDEEEE